MMYSSISKGSSLPIMYGLTENLWDMPKTVVFRLASELTIISSRGNNRLTVKVFRYSDGSYLEGQDYWKYSGIERSVYLCARPKSRVKDFRIEATLVNGYKDGQLSLDIRMTAPEKGQRISVKVLDRDNEIYKSEYSLRSVSDTLVRFDKYVANVRPSEC